MAQYGRLSCMDARNEYRLPTECHWNVNLRIYKPLFFYVHNRSLDGPVTSATKIPRHNHKLTINELLEVYDYYIGLTHRLLLGNGR